MSVLRAEMAKSALTLVKAIGFPMKLRRVSKGAYDTATGTTSETVSELDVLAIVVSNARENVDQGFEVNARRAYVQSASGAIPEVGDRLTGIDVEATIKKVHSIFRDPTDTIISICEVHG